ncbi:hypothetical protein [Aurantimonas sp. HBX-1]|uniref:hypothetical protein n=1 Tax=Aurantimonas sp. HBX-1 TaxID=2906072 RepID=UPI001F4834D1|nr:hypothetical protein [Aurantimonas sp. HBX-1]UIJ73477.1 hypothetical protein LXB15_07545 [Aurantimonas sp. HBX-1]
MAADQSERPPRLAVDDGPPEGVAFIREFRIQALPEPQLSLLDALEIKNLVAAPSEVGVDRSSRDFFGCVRAIAVEYPAHSHGCRFDACHVVSLGLITQWEISCRCPRASSPRVCVPTS